MQRTKYITALAISYCDNKQNIAFLSHTRGICMIHCYRNSKQAFLKLFHMKILIAKKR